MVGHTTAGQGIATGITIHSGATTLIFTGHGVTTTVGMVMAGDGDMEAIGVDITPDTGTVINMDIMTVTMVMHTDPVIAEIPITDIVEVMVEAPLYHPAICPGESVHQL